MRMVYVGPTGNREAKLGVCGEQPGKEEVLSGRPFVGPAGQELDRCLQMTKIPRLDLYLTNVIKDLDAPLATYIEIDFRTQRFAITPDGYTYIQELGEELSGLNLNAIVAFGNAALIALASRMGIGKWRGSVLESTLVPNLKVIPTYHPATIIIPKFQFLNKPLICEDLILARKESQFSGINRTPRNIMIQPSFQEAVGALNHCYEVGAHGRTIDYDIEVINEELDCISFSWSPVDSISIPFKDWKGDYFTIDQEYEIMLLINKIISSPKIAKRGAYIIFDVQFLFRKYGIVPRGDFHCTQIAQKIAYPDYSAGLDFVTTMHTDIPYYKQDGKQWMKMGVGTWEEWWTYSGTDAIATSAAHPNQIEVLTKQDNLAAYDRQRKLIKPLTYMAERGIRIDVEGMMEYKASEQVKLDQLATELNEEVGYEINYNSPKQLADYFYKELKIKPYKKKSAFGKYVETTDVDALKRIARRGYKAARIMLDIRSISKRISTYLNIGKIDNDGRYRSSYNPVGAETGRISSGKTIFGRGGNQQNWPHDLLRFFLFDEGYVGYSIDLAQIENRIVAYVGGVISQIQAFEGGTDLHRLTASIIFNKPYNEISGEDGSSTLGDGRQSERFWGKKGNHAINYDVSYVTFALKNEIPEGEAKLLIEKIHKGYPQIRGGYHQVIQGMLRKNRTVENLFGRKRLFLSPIVSSYPNVPKSFVQNTFREAYAQLPQSTTADKINEHGVEYIYYNQDLFAPIELLTQIHDSIVFQVPLTVPWTEHARMILLIKHSLEQPLEWHGTEIKTPADLSIGWNMCKSDMKELKGKEVPNDAEALGLKIKKVWEELHG